MSRSLRDALGRFATGVVLIAATTPDGRVGMAVNSFTSLSLDPPLVGFGVAHTSTTWPRLQAAGRFAISVLAAHHGELCRRFAAPGDRFAGGDWGVSPAGHPVVPDGLGWFDCTPVAEHRAGDHDFVVAAARSWGITGHQAPLVFHAGGFLGTAA